MNTLNPSTNRITKGYRHLEPGESTVDGDSYFDWASKTWKWACPNQPLVKGVTYRRRVGSVTPAPVWEYSYYRTTLKKNGKIFALVSPNGRDALSPQAAEELLSLLNRPL